MSKIDLLSTAQIGDVVQITELLAWTEYDSQAAELIEMILARWPEISFGDASVLLDTARWWIALWGLSSKAQGLLEENKEEARP